MRQLKGKVKENAKEKKERKKEFAENRDKAFSVGNLSSRLNFSKLFIPALPILGGLFALIVVLVYVATRPKQLE